jgi:hypothetical protein
VCVCVCVILLSHVHRDIFQIFLYCVLSLVKHVHYILVLLTFFIDILVVEYGPSHFNLLTNLFIADLLVASYTVSIEILTELQ